MNLQILHFDFSKNQREIFPLEDANIIFRETIKSIKNIKSNDILFQVLFYNNKFSFQLYGNTKNFAIFFF